jgi:hypothetical protein
MRIATSQVHLTATSLSSTTTSTIERLHAWNRQSDLTINSSLTNGINVAQAIKLTDIFEQQSAVQTGFSAPSSQPQATAARWIDPLKRLGLGSNSQLSDNPHDVRYSIMKQLIEMMTGKKIELFDPSDVTNGNQPAAQTDSSPDAATQAASSAPASKGWGITYDRVDKVATSEGFDFSAKGEITTADGTKVAFSATLTMSRESSSELRVSLKAGDALLDPLVLDFSGSGASFTQDSMSFDLNNDGTAEKIAAPSATTAFLAYDKNGNGIIDSGAELFGPASGNGFGDLTSLDTDHNGWIDENDSAFNNLRLLQHGADGTDILRTLAEAGVGALYTGATATPFTLTSQQEGIASSDAVIAQTGVGAVRESGIFLRENGAAGFMQEVDLSA